MVNNKQTIKLLNHIQRNIFPSILWQEFFGFINYYTQTFYGFINFLIFQYILFLSCRVDQVSEFERNKNTMNLGGYLKEKISKTQTKITKVSAQVEELERSKLLFDCMKGKKLTDITDEATINNLIEMVDNKLSVCTYRLQKLKKENQSRVTNDAYELSTEDEDFLGYH